MKDLVIDTFLSVKSQVNPNRRTNNFELFGYDFLIDEDFRVWLIEVNSNPGMELIEDNNIVEKNKKMPRYQPDLVDEMF